MDDAFVARLRSDLATGALTLGFPIGDPFKDIMDIINGDLPPFNPTTDTLVPTPWGFLIVPANTEA